jgi:hypothetical protein
MKLAIGVLVVGSLDWESKDYGEGLRRDLTSEDRARVVRRSRWRRERLRTDPASEYPVRVPIRYGRESVTRGHTFTMVFSPEYQARLGTAKAIRCAREVSSIKDLVAEATELWVAESNERHRGELSADWGCVVLVKPNDFLDRPDQGDRRTLLQGWAAHTSRLRSYGRLGFSQADQESAQGLVITDGRLRIAWPRVLDGSPLPFDLLLATATNPEIGSRRLSYPSATEIAEAWKARPEFAYYFHFNRRTGIRTADDDEIDKLLK